MEDDSTEAADGACANLAWRAHKGCNEAAQIFAEESALNLGPTSAYVIAFGRVNQKFDRTKVTSGSFVAYEGGDGQPHLPCGIRSIAEFAARLSAFPQAVRQELIDQLNARINDTEDLADAQ